MGKRLLVIGVLLAACAIPAANSTGASLVRVGTLVVRADGGFQPRVLPRRTYAPISFQGYGKISTTNGTVPPAVEHVKVEFDRDGLLTTTGLSACQPSKLKGASSQQARRRCSDAIVGTGHVGAAVTLAGLARIDLSAPMTVFNGPRRGGNPTAILHAQAPFPVSETYVIVVPIERRGGAYRYRTSFDVPPIAGGLGSITRLDAKIGRRYEFRGSERSYVSARCSDYILQTRGYLSFADGNVIYGSLFKTCTPED
jgi:hypothetical protein